MNWPETFDELTASNYHGHTQWCDGRSTMSEIAEAASKESFRHFGFSPHSPAGQHTSCNMEPEDVVPYLEECDRLKDLYAPEMTIYKGMEVDWMGERHGPHIDYFQKLPLDYRIGSVHFLPRQYDGVLIDMDGRFPRFSAHLHEHFNDDIRYVVERYFEEELRMIERGGFEILGHFDKIANNASQAWPELEDQPWYEAYIDDVISHIASQGIIAEVNTKWYEEGQRFFPARRWWPKLKDAGVRIVVNSDVHFADKVSAGRHEALEALKKDGTITQ